MTPPFDPDGIYAALGSGQWLTLKAAVEGDEGQREAALDLLGALVTDERLNPRPVPDMVNRGREEREAMRRARERYRDRWVRDHCEAAIWTLQGQRDADSPYNPQQVDSFGRDLLLIGTEFLNLSRSRAEDREIEDSA